MAGCMVNSVYAFPESSYYLHVIDIHLRWHAIILQMYIYIELCIYIYIWYMSLTRCGCCSWRKTSSSARLWLLMFAQTTETTSCHPRDLIMSLSSRTPDSNFNWWLKQPIWRFLKIGVPLNHPFKRNSHCKPSSYWVHPILGNPRMKRNHISQSYHGWK